jgi:hypothetical protein
VLEEEVDRWSQVGYSHRATLGASMEAG